MEEINNMPIRDRRAYIKLHNAEQTRKKNKLDSIKHSTSKSSINNLARNTQERIKNGTDNIP